MKTIYITLAAVSAMAVAAPLAAQPRSLDRPAPQSWLGDRQSTHQLQARFDAGVESGAITRSEATPLRAQLRQLAQLERHYARAGFNGWERNALRERSRGLSMDLMAAERTGNRRLGRDDRFSDNDRRDDRFSDTDRRDTRGDRFAGDVRVGQRFSARQVALPAQYRDRYKDSEASYYRYDDDRIYQIDRASGLITAMFNIGG